VNWARTESATPSRWHRPATEDDVRDVVTRARSDGRRLRVVGSGHSFSAIAVPDDEAMSLAGLRGAPIVDRTQGTVTVPGGTRLRDVSAMLLPLGLSLPIVGSIQAQTVAGAIATGTHGSSLRHGNLAGLVTELRLVTGTGDVLTVRGDDPRLDGVRVHLGVLGVVTSVTLRTRAAVRLHQTIEQVPIEQVADLLEEVAHSAEYVKVWWLPHAPTAQVVRYAETTLPVTRRPSAATMRWVDERVLHRAVFPAMVALQHRRPAITAGLNRWLSRRYLGAASQVGASGLMLNTPMPVRHRETEAAVPLSRATEAVKGVLALFDGGRPAVNFPLEIRFVRGDGMWLSPAYGGDTCQIGAYTTAGPDCDRYFAGFWDVMRPLGARPHWGKELDHDAAALRELYPEFDRFRALRDELDPERVFGGTTVDRLLGA
jgi:FAD/FMN-containing dehydrogenase